MDIEKKYEKLKTEYQEYISTTTHDFNNIFRSLSLVSDWLDEAIKEEDWEEVRKLLSLMKEKANNGQEMITSLGDWSKIRHISPTFEEINIENVIEKTISQIDKEGLQLNIENKIKLFKSDQNILAFIFTELIKNSITFNQNSNKEIKILLNEQENHYIIEYIDNGNEIREFQTVNIFKIFNSSKKIHESEHMGMGLPKCIRYLELIDGTIELLESSPNGSKFLIKILKPYE